MQYEKDDTEVKKTEDQKELGTHDVDSISTEVID